MNFKEMKAVVDSNVTIAKSQRNLFVANVDRDLLWETYLNSFPLSERQEHNCNTCRHFIKNAGAIVWLDSELTTHTLWEGSSQPTLSALHQLVVNTPITSKFYASPQHWKFGAHQNHTLNSSGESITWTHFCFETPTAMQTPSVGTRVGESQSKFGTLKRAFETITTSALADVLDLIKENNLYRGEQHRELLVSFQQLLVNYQQLPAAKQPAFCWAMSASLSSAVTGIRNTSLGQLLLAISEGTSLDVAVNAYERMTAPANYRRPAGTIVSSKALQQAQQTVEELGLTAALERRHATLDDIPVGNSLFIHRTNATTGNIFDSLKSDIKVKAKPQDFKDLPTVSIEELPALLQGANTLEIYLEGELAPNLVTLTAGQYAGKSLFAWDNAVGWSYNNALADSDIKQRVKEAGGNVKGKLRNSLAWFNTDDLDLHLYQPNAAPIYHGTRHSGYGSLDVDMNVRSPLRRDAVENIVYANTVPNGDYKLFVNNFNKRENVDVGFNVEIEFNGTVYTFSYPQAVVNNVTVAQYTINNGEITFTGGLTPTVGHSPGRKLWGLGCNTFQQVNLACLSPNYWGYNKGNKHYFFFLEGAIPEGMVRPLFNEFLDPQLLQHHRQVFEVLGSRINLNGKPTLGGLGFSVGSKRIFTCRLNTTAGTKLINVIS